MSDPTPPRIEFPCRDYPIKIVGHAREELHSWVATVMERHVPDYEPHKASVRDSRNGRYQSITVFITATGEAQLTAISEDLKESGAVKMVL